ncbi:PAS domain-containing protein [Methylobacterium sp. SI9]|uniref:PAS domain-containing protein n=1 Tax=Methylobacterium guangdongense TaxID=3138811 RepID=UPI00313E33E1
MTEGFLGLSHASSTVLSGLNIGTWDSDLTVGVTRGDAIFARLFGFTPEEAACGVSAGRFDAAFHPDDRGVVERQRREAAGDGGLFVFEHRTVPTPGQIRWVLARGQFERDAGGAVVRCRGICIDTTDSRAEGHIAGRLHVRIGEVEDTPPLDRLAELAVAVWETLAETDPKTDTAVRPIVRMLLDRIARRIAVDLDPEDLASTDTSDDEPSVPRGRTH